MKKILFNDKYGLTKAVLDGRKTQTRRAIIEDELLWFYELSADKNGKTCAVFTVDDGWGGWFDEIYPNYQPGEVVAVAQSYRDILGKEYLSASAENEIIKLITDDVAGVSNKMFVKSHLMPHRIEFGDIRVERLQDISDDDCLKEGVIRFGECYAIEEHDQHGKICRLHCSTSPREAFAFLIDKTCGKGTWDNNPWMFVYDFKLVKR